MTETCPSIVVAGDVAIDWLEWDSRPHEQYNPADRDQPNWAMHESVHMVAREGGAFLLARMVGQAIGGRVLAPEIPPHQSIETIPPDTVLHSLVTLAAYPFPEPVRDTERKIFRVRRFRGYCRPSPGMATPPALPAREDACPDLVILDDTGNAFRHTRPAWPKALTDGKTKPVVILKQSRPLCRGELWDHLSSGFADRLVVFIDADDLRDCGVNISRRLSWERTALDLCWQLENNPNPVAASLAACRHLVVRFGIDGAVYCRRDDGSLHARLYYDPQVAEGEFAEGCPGGMQGLSSAFAAALAVRVAAGGIAGIGEGIRDGLLCARRLLRLGFGAADGVPDYPVGELFLPAPGMEAVIADVDVPPVGTNGSSRIETWTILGELTRTQLEEVAYITVEEGPAAVLPRAPVGRFGDFITVDRTEIESYRSIRNLMKEYLERKETRSPPLSIAVFGPPGSGKSFGFTEIAASLGRDVIEKLVFNLSQFESPADLVNAFHRVRDLVLKGKVPLVFFDEFDADFRGGLGWLKYFLAPMQDGEFRDGETMHPIGKSIFVFAGGTRHTFQDFSGEGSPPPGEDVARAFREAKGTDFISRLRGFVNIMGINPAGADDSFYLIRRAMLLRTLLREQAPQIFDGNGRANIDRNVLRAMIKVPVYRHGARSMVAVIEMSMLADRTRFEQAVLPSREQLRLHLDADLFSRLVLRDVLFGDALDALAETLHTHALQELERSGEIPPDAWRIRPWTDLGEEHRTLIRARAARIPALLETIGCRFIPCSGRPDGLFRFDSAEVETIARLEHERWSSEMAAAGWYYGPVKEEARRIHPALVVWDDLPPEERELQVRSVRQIPAALADAGFEIYRQ